MSGSDKSTGGTVLPREYDVARSASAGPDKKSIHVKDIQLNPNQIGEVALNGHNIDFLKLVVNHDGDNKNNDNSDAQQFQMYGRVERRDESFNGPELRDKQVGLGLPLREAIAVVPGDTVTVDYVGFEQPSELRQCLNQILAYKPVVVRVRSAVHPDVGQKIVRMTEATRQVIGIEWGDRVVLQSSDARVLGIKALPLTNEQESRVDSRREPKSSRYPPAFNEQELGSNTGTVVDIPTVYVSSSIREGLNLTEYETPDGLPGIDQPIKIHRDSKSVCFRLLDELTIPALAAIFALVVGIGLAWEIILVLIILAFSIIVLSVIFRSRRVLLN